MTDKEKVLLYLFKNCSGSYIIRGVIKFFRGNYYFVVFEIFKRSYPSYKEIGSTTEGRSVTSSKRFGESSKLQFPSRKW